METNKIQGLNTPYSTTPLSIGVSTNKRKESPTGSDNETNIVANEIIGNDNSNASPETKRRKLEQVTGAVENLGLSEGQKLSYLNTVDKIKGNLDSFTALISFFDVESYSKQAEQLHNETSVAVDHLKSTIESLLGEVAHLQTKDTKREVRLQPVDVERYKTAVLQPFYERIADLQQKFTALATAMKECKPEGLAKEQFLMNCQSHVTSYIAFADAVWRLKADINGAKAALQKNIKDSDCAPLSKPAVATTIALCYVDSEEQSTSDQKCLEENKARYNDLLSLLEQMQAKELRAVQSLCDGVTKELNWSCYQYDYLNKHSKLPSNWTLSSSVPITVINPFVVLERPKSGAVVEDKQGTFLVEKIT